jgi:hypothetical protein
MGIESGAALKFGSRKSDDLIQVADKAERVHPGGFSVALLFPFD